MNRIDDKRIRRGIKRFVGDILVDAAVALVVCVDKLGTFVLESLFAAVDPYILQAE